MANTTLTHDLDSPFTQDILTDGYHIFSREKAKQPGFYPSSFPEYPGVRLKNLVVGDRITVRAFFRIGSGENWRVDGGYLDFEVEFIGDDHLMGEILTELPQGFPLATGDSLEICEDEILYKVSEPTTH